MPFDHVENRTLNARGNRFEVIYRSYEPIDGSYVDLIAREIIPCITRIIKA